MARIKFGVDKELEGAANALLFPVGVRDGGDEVWKSILSPYQLDDRARHEYPLGNDPTHRRGLHYRVYNRRQYWLNSADVPGGAVRNPPPSEDGEHADVWAMASGEWRGMSAE